ncbi:hypothetical protein PoB_000892400 [Plakobranchus ocellatus]|uniref:Uncharacterized protein n=1 Tax=Plakobranchus ocellatus TaxID=259542 RepID=A0AAV3YK63_9GAST|nr:hypothetical protein PoB_000892400 [Plakobranchus ocellatus]
MIIQITLQGGGRTSMRWRVSNGGPNSKDTNCYRKLTTERDEEGSPFPKPSGFPSDSSSAMGLSCVHSSSTKDPS